MAKPTRLIAIGGPIALLLAAAIALHPDREHRPSAADGASASGKLAAAHGRTALAAPEKAPPRATAPDASLPGSSGAPAAPTKPAQAAAVPPSDLGEIPRPDPEAMRRYSEQKATFEAQWNDRARTYFLQETSLGESGFESYRGLEARRAGVEAELRAAERARAPAGQPILLDARQMMEREERLAAADREMADGLRALLGKDAAERLDSLRREHATEAAKTLSPLLPRAPR